MKRILTSSMALAALAAAPSFAQRKAAIENVPEIPYTSAPSSLKLPPGEYLGESVAVATNSKGHIFVYHRSANTRLFEFDRAGNFVKEIGSGYYGFEFAHSVRVDKDDNIWTVDEGTNMITKFSPDGKVMMVLGRRPPAVLVSSLLLPARMHRRRNIFSAGRRMSAGTRKATSSFPTATATTAWSSTTRTDGSSRSPAAKSPARRSENSIFLTACRWMRRAIWVADRSNFRYQVLDNNLKPIREVTNLGVGWTVCISAGPHQYAFLSNSNPNGNLPGSWAITGEIYKTELDGTVLGKFGHPGKLAPGFQVVHTMDCRNPNEIITGEIESWRVQKLILQPTTTSAKTVAAR